MEKRIADGLGLKIGDSLTVNVLGRNITARIANLRVVDWQSLGINFVLVYSPNAFRGAPHTHIATLTFPGDTTAAAGRRDPARHGDGVSGGHHRAGEGCDRRRSARWSEISCSAIRGASLITLIAAALVLARRARGQPPQPGL